MRWLKLWVLRRFGLIEPCSLVENPHDGLYADDQCLLCSGRGWTPTRSMIQAMIRAMAKDARDHVHPYDSWAAAEQIIDLTLGDWVDTWSDESVTA